MPPTKPPHIPARTPVTNEHWDPQVMLRKAQAGSYPTAKSSRPSRDVFGLSEHEAEVAYWRQRCDLPVDLPDDVASEAIVVEPDADERFLQLRPMQQRARIHNFLTSTDEGDQARGAALCALCGRDVAHERAAAATIAARKLAACQERLLQQDGGRRSGSDSRTTAATPATEELWSS